ncbi:hypothetical protein Q5752_007095 [Cryptotrichosporon argae]
MLAILCRPARSLPISTTRLVAVYTRSAMSSSHKTVSDVITHDHRELDEYYNNILGASDDDARARWQNQFTWELARHSIGEELVVYPAMEEHVVGGKALADHDRAEHNKVKVLLEKFQDLSPSAPDFEPTIRKLYATLAEHIKEEESDDLPKLESALGPERSKELAASFQRTKHFVPTRSHPSAPDKPPFETVVGLLAAPIDRLGDLFRRFPKD